jgi:hypothetical protein
VEIDIYLQNKKRNVHKQDAQNSHQQLQQYLNCYLETNPSTILKQWDDNRWQGDSHVDTDETCLKYIALVLLDAMAHKANKIGLEVGCPALIICNDEDYLLPTAPESMLARGLEIVCDICGMEKDRTNGILCLGVRCDSIQLRIEKRKGIHIIDLPDLGNI